MLVTPVGSLFHLGKKASKVAVWAEAAWAEAEMPEATRIAQAPPRMWKANNHLYFPEHRRS